MTYILIGALQQKLQAGETPHMVLMPMPAIANLAKAGKLKSEGSAPFGTTSIVAIVREVLRGPIFLRRRRSAAQC